jgi:hypothetical protein
MRNRVPVLLLHDEPPPPPLRWKNTTKDYRHATTYSIQCKSVQLTKKNYYNNYYYYYYCPKLLMEVPIYFISVFRKKTTYI